MEVSDQLHREEPGTHWIRGLMGPRTGKVGFWRRENLLPLPGFEPRNVHIIASRFFRTFSSCPSSFLRVHFLPFPCSFCLFVKCPRTSPFLYWQACLAYSSTAKWSSQPLDLQNDMQQAFGYNLGRAHYKWTYDDISFQEARSHCAQTASHPTSLASRALHNSRLGLCLGRAHKRPTCTAKCKRARSASLHSSATPSRLNRQYSIRILSLFVLTIPESSCRFLLIPAFLSN